MIKQKADAVQTSPQDFAETGALQLQDWQVEPDDETIADDIDFSDPQTELVQHQPESNIAQQNISALLEAEQHDAPPEPLQATGETILPPWEEDEPGNEDLSGPGPDSAFNMFAADEETPETAPATSMAAMPRPDGFAIAGQGQARAGRVKTRILGFSAGMGAGADPFGAAPNEARQSQPGFPVAWLVITHGPGRGTAFTLYPGVAQIGRGEGQTLRLDFGDTAISRENHAAIAYDAEQNSFFIGHGGKANIVRCNNRPVLSTQELEPGDSIRIGETTLRFVPLCGPGFQWDASDAPEKSHARRG